MNASMQVPAATEERLKTREYVGYALGDTASNLFFQTFNIFLTYYYVDVWGIAATALLWMLPIIQAIDAIFDPAMGLIADRTNTRWGKFRPYLFWGAIPYGICGYLMFAGPDFQPTGKLVYAYITYGLMLLSYSVINVPYSSLLGVLSPNSGTRAVASSFRFVGAFAGGFLISFLVRPLVKVLGELGATPAKIEAAATNKAIQGQLDTHGFQWAMGIFAVVSVVMFLLCFAWTKERVKPPRDQKTNVKEELGELLRNWPWITLLVASVLSTSFIALRSGSVLFYFKYVVKDDGSPLFKIGTLPFDHATLFLSSGMLAQVVGTMALGFIARKVDKKWGAVTLCTITALCFMSFYFIPKEQFALQVTINVIAYLCMGPTSALTWALYGDVADYGEWKFGRRSTGLVFSASLFSIKTGVMVGNFLLPLFLAYFGYIKGAEQTTNAQWGITLAFSLVAGFIGLLKASSLAMFPLNRKRIREIENELAARRAAASAEARLLDVFGEVPAHTRNFSVSTFFGSFCGADKPMNITNPILCGFNPDPSILRVGDDFYIATSTFEWYPGVQIHHSKDLVNWRLLTRPLRRASQLDMRGDPDSCGIWAPCLTYANGLFHLIYTDVKRYGRASGGGLANASLRDFHNYLVTAEKIDGDWSDPIYMNSSGFDPSLFHDDDGRKWFVNMLWDHRPGQNRFKGILLQEYSPKEKKLIGQRKNIFPGTSIGFCEAPHLYKRDGYYHLMTAEGGTFWGHAVTMARSKKIDGPYELHPDMYVITARDKPDCELQRAGHGSLVETQKGDTYITYLCGRPIPRRGRCTLGRETAIQKMIWGSDGWLRTLDGKNAPTVTTPAPGLPECKWPTPKVREDFDSKELPIDFQWLRTPYPEQVFSLKERPGHLRVYGRESLGSQFEQGMVGRRQQAFCFTATVKMEYDPQHYQQSAGLIYYYHSTKFIYLYLSEDETNGRHLRVFSCVTDIGDGFGAPIKLPAGTKDIELRMDVDFERLYFSYRLAGGQWQRLPTMYDASIVSDEAGLITMANFTGAFIAVCNQDTAGTRRPADFDYFEYREREFQPKLAID